MEDMSQRTKASIQHQAIHWAAQEGGPLAGLSGGQVGPLIDQAMKRLADEIRVRREKRINEVLAALRLPYHTKEEKLSLISTFTSYKEIALLPREKTTFVAVMREQGFLKQEILKALWHAETGPPYEKASGEYEQIVEQLEGKVQKNTL